MILDKVYNKYENTMDTYGFFNIQDGKSYDFQLFITNYVIPYSEDQGFIIDYSSFDWIEDNAVLNPEVKKVMNKHNCNVSHIRLMYIDETIAFVFNFLNEKEKYEYCSFSAHKKKINI